MRTQAKQDGVEIKPFVTYILWEIDPETGKKSFYATYSNESDAKYDAHSLLINSQRVFLLTKSKHTPRQ